MSLAQNEKLVARSVPASARFPSAGPVGQAADAGNLFICDPTVSTSDRVPRETTGESDSVTTGTSYGYGSVPLNSPLKTGARAPSGVPAPATSGKTSGTKQPPTSGSVAATVLATPESEAAA